ncbi:uncharacterized protein LOC132727856 [Ruditapes philippinarum]|uniref:uncharacterized protein LOC132727856 n=1 Tax=Ruditapes philippinarum TaxID=129788 RepID=UPI00295A6AC9|nr:uncharacterized protein LOC132727856 [Ruditapes philippinarum]
MGYICSENELHNVTNWTDAVEKCELATPDITLDANGYRAEIQDDEWSGQVWTGYYMTTLYFDYIGCVQVFQREANFMSQRNTPGTCHTTCRTSMIGVKGDECYCLNNDKFDNDMQLHCNTLCDTQNGVVCGGNQHMSVYRITNVSGDISDGNIENGCLGVEYQYVSKIFKWKNCSEFMRPLCLYTGLEKSTNGRHYPWTTAASRCFEHDTTPISYTSASKFKTVLTGIYWTGTIRSQVIHKYDGELVEGSNIRYGYLTKNENNVTIVLFSENNRKMRRLCKHERTPNTQRPASVYVFVAIFLVVFIVGIIVAVIIWKKRKSTQEAPVRQESSQNHYITPLFKKEDDYIYSEVTEMDKKETNKFIGDDGYEIPLMKSSSIYSEVVETDKKETNFLTDDGDYEIPLKKTSSN